MVAQKPLGSLMPPLSGSHGGACDPDPNAEARTTSPTKTKKGVRRRMRSPRVRAHDHVASNLPPWGPKPDSAGPGLLACETHRVGTILQAFQPWCRRRCLSNVTVGGAIPRKSPENGARLERRKRTWRNVYESLGDDAPRALALPDRGSSPNACRPTVAGDSLAGELS